MRILQSAVTNGNDLEQASERRTGDGQKAFFRLSQSLPGWFSEAWGVIVAGVADPGAGLSEAGYNLKCDNLKPKNILKA